MPFAPAWWTSYETVNPAVIGASDTKPGSPLRRMAEVLAGAMQGKLNITGHGIADGTSTTLQDPRIGPQSCIFFMATTQQGAGLNMWVVSRGNGTAQLSHQNATNEPFSYIVIG